QGPAVTRHLVFRLDQPQRGTFCKPLLDIPTRELGIPKTSNLLKVGMAKFSFTPPAVDTHRTWDINGTQALPRQITIENDHAVRKKNPFQRHSSTLDRRPKTVARVISRETRN